MLPALSGPIEEPESPPKEGTTDEEICFRGARRRARPRRLPVDTAAAAAAAAAEEFTHRMAVVERAGNIGCRFASRSVEQPLADVVERVDAFVNNQTPPHRRAADVG